MFAIGGLESQDFVKYIIFQPVGDLPEGIVVPPPVFNNDTIEGEENYDYDGQFEENPKLTVQTRARQESQQAFAGK